MLGRECHSNPPILNSSSGVGYVTNIAGLNSYVTGSPNAIILIILISDIFGYKAPLFREIADKFAAKGGYRVYCPDMFNDDPFDPENENRPLPVWLEDHEPEKGFETVKPFIEALKSEGASSIGAAGFCWGGKTVSDLSKSKLLVQTSVLLHPAYVEKDDISAVEVPIAILGAQNDTITPPSTIKQFKQVLDAKPEVDSLVKIFPNVSHGWTVRYDTEDPEAVKAADKAHQITLHWFDKHLK
ncbi:endo-1,3;1,4-beta-D-glucanase [Cajanus cajan]|uniref:endo-1,3;1,4-beta-D-glucanase n=1 Tax=Cajanus cajan TaxID=3821 RepID=UPI00098DBE0D|nr:endo-1,3;1,4-beta-D-glucanase [Cajanus cajan]